jgi:dTMP kinase
MSNNYPGNFIVVEGIDGSGTTTLSMRLEERIKDSVWTNEPSNGYYGKMLRESLSDEDSPDGGLGDFFMFLADRDHHLREFIVPNLKDGKTVICDRFHASTLTYQKDNVEERLGKSVEDFAHDCTWDWMVEPDIELLVDVDVDIAKERRELDSKYEEEEFLMQVRRDYLNLLSRKENMFMLDGSTPIEEVVDQAELVLLNEDII